MAKIIAVPINIEAKNALDFDEARKDQLIEIELSNEDFYELYDYGLFRVINEICGSNIDDFEDEVIDDFDKMKIAISALLKNENSTEISVVGRIIQLFTEAIERRTGIYFFF